MASQSIDGLVRRLAIVWHRKWWILVPTLLTAVMTSVVSHYFLPIRYQSEASILIVPQRVSAEYVRGRADGQAGDRLQRTSAVVMSRSILERIIAEGNLYEGERRTMPMAEVIRQMRNDISLTVKPHDPMGTDVGFKVSFVSSNPRTAQRGTERLASLFVEENLREREVETEGTVEFISAQIEDVKRQIIGYEKRFDQLLAQDGGRRHPSRTDVLEYEALQETYKTLLTKSQESKISASLERRQISEQYRVVESARLPEEPVGPSRLRVNVMGGLAGLALGLVFVGVSVRRRP